MPVLQPCSSPKSLFLVSGWSVSQEEQSCGSAAINAIVGKRAISDMLLREFQAMMGLPRGLFEEKGTCIPLLLAVLSRHGFFQDIRCCHRAQVGFCNQAVAGACAYLFNDGHHWTVVKSAGRDRWMLHDDGDITFVSDISKYIQEFEQRSLDHWVVPISRDQAYARSSNTMVHSCSVLAR